MSAHWNGRESARRRAVTERAVLAELRRRPADLLLVVPMDVDGFGVELGNGFLDDTLAWMHKGYVPEREVGTAECRISIHKRRGVTGQPGPGVRAQGVLQILREGRLPILFDKANPLRHFLPVRRADDGQVLALGGHVAVARAEHHELAADRDLAAREHGDLSENFEYHSARNEQSFIEGRIQELEAIVRNHKLIQQHASTGRVELLSTVHFSEGGGPEESYQLVGPAEADPKAGRVSHESAIGKALLGRQVGDEVEVVTDTGFSYTVKITSID